MCVPSTRPTRPRTFLCRKGKSEDPFTVVCTEIFRRYEYWVDCAKYYGSMANGIFY